MHKRDGDQRLRLALQAGQMGTWELDLRTGAMICSEETDRLIGMSPGRTLTQVETILERIHSDDANDVLRALEQSVERRQNCETEFRVRLPNGEARWISLRGEVLRDESGAALRLIGVMADISARKTTEEARRAAEQERYLLMREAQGRAAELVAVMESMPDALLIGNGALVTLANRPALDLFGCETVTELNELNQDAPALAERASVRDVSTGEQMSPNQWPFQRALAGESRVQDLIVHHAKLGHDVVLRCTAAPIRVSNFPIGAVCVFADLARSRQQTLIRNLIEAQEEERRAVAYELHDGLTQYIMAAHAHLESFSCFLPHAVQSEPAAREFQQGITYLDQAVVESRRLINGLRALALDDLGLAGALEQTLNEEKERAGWQEAEWAHNIPGRRYPKILETAVYRVAQEALTNARKHARASRVRLLLLDDTNDSGEPVLSLEVRDWGAGFLPEETTTQYGHLGLQGMFERVNLVGGIYHLHSAPGRGTTVRAIFPANVAAASPHDAANQR